MQNFEFSLHEQGEEILMYFRGHFATNIPWILGVILFSLLPLGIWPFLRALGLPSDIVILSLSLWYLFAFGVGLGFFSHWFFNIYILTNKRIIDIDYDGFLFHKISSAPLTEVQDISHDVHGPIELLLDFGDVYIQTASESVGEFDFKHVPNPEMVHRKISEAVDKVKK